MHACMHTSMHACNIHTCVCLYTHNIYIYIYRYAHIHIHYTCIYIYEYKYTPTHYDARGYGRSMLIRSVGSRGSPFGFLQQGSCLTALRIRPPRWRTGDSDIPSTNPNELWLLYQHDIYITFMCVYIYIYISCWDRQVYISNMICTVYIYVSIYIYIYTYICIYTVSQLSIYIYIHIYIIYTHEVGKALANPGSARFLGAMVKAFHPIL